LGKNRKILIYFGLTVIVLFQLSLYLHQYYIHYPFKSQEWWHYGYKQLAVFAKENGNKYDYVIWSDRSEPPLIFSLFWLKIDPKITQNTKGKLNWTKISDAVTADNLPGTNYYYGHVSEERIKVNGFIGTLKQNMLYLVPQGEIGQDYGYAPIPSSIKVLDSIYYPSGTVSDYVLTGL
jgi:hypothetical protein